MYQDSVSLNATIGYSFSGNTYYILSGGVADFIFFHDGFSNYVFDFLNVNAGIRRYPVSTGFFYQFTVQYHPKTTVFYGWYDSENDISYDYEYDILGQGIGLSGEMGYDFDKDDKGLSLNLQSGASLSCFPKQEIWVPLFSASLALSWK